MSFLFGDYRASTSKGGPRVLTFHPTLAGQIIANCPGCSARWTPSLVTGEDFACDPADPGVGGLPLPIGWYELQTEVDVYWQQVNPKDACSIDPFCTGLLLRAGGCAIFYVDAANRDGILVLKFCSVSTTGTSCGGVPSGFARVNRRDTILPPSVTGESAGITPAEPSRACANPAVAGSSATCTE